MFNVLMVTIDCLRADGLGCMGYGRPLSPHIDRLAAGSALFTRAFATGPRTTESFPGILASTYPLAYGGTFTLPSHLLTLAKVLRPGRYASAAFHSNPFLLSEFGYAQGFEHFWDSREKTAVTSKVGARIMPRLNQDSRLYRLLRRMVRYLEAKTGVSYYTGAEEVTDRAVRWLRGQVQPFLLWVHYMDMHYPFSPPERHIRQVRPEGVGWRQQARLMVHTLEDPLSVTKEEAQMYRDLYDAGLHYVDENVGALLDALQRMGILHDTIVVLTADHGEEFLEHGDFGHGALIHVPGTDAARIKLYDELLHVPLIVRVPGSDVAPRQVPSLVSLADVGPTIVDLLGLETVEPWHGLSLVPLLRGQANSVRDHVFSEYVIRDGDGHWPVVSCRTLRWKYIHDGLFEHHELYDLEDDPAEQRNLYGSQVPVLSALQEAVQEHLALFPSSPLPVVEAEMDPAVVERLKGLGYLG